MCVSTPLLQCQNNIRRALLSFEQKCSVPEFLWRYRQITNHPLPSKELGFSSDIELLKSMPHIINISTNANGHYRLQAAEGIRSSSRKTSENSNTMSSSSSASSTTWMSAKGQSEASLASSVSLLSLSEHSDSASVKSEASSGVYVPPKGLYAKRLRKCKLQESRTSAIAVQEKISSASHSSDSPNKSLPPDLPRFSFLEECDAYIPPPVESDYVLHGEKKNEDWEEPIKVFPNVRQPRSYSLLERLKKLEDEAKSAKERIIPESTKRQLEMVANSFPQGIWASEFLDRFEEINDQQLYFRILNFDSLADFIEAVPEIFTKRFVAGCRNNYVIEPSERFSLRDVPKCSLLPVDALLIDHAILNIRNILMANPEGIRVDELSEVYKDKCRDNLYIRDMGFEDIKEFLAAVKDRVALKFRKISGYDYVQYKKTGEDILKLPYVQTEEEEKDSCVAPDIKYKHASLPPDMDFSIFHEMYISGVMDPHAFFIQLAGEQGNDDEYISQEKEIDDFYKGSKSKLYFMKEEDIKVNTPCAALYPSLQWWFRAIILNVTSEDTVKVLYVDYGNIEAIPKSLLRYLTLEFAQLPINVIKCGLAYVKPANNASKWDPKAQPWLIGTVKDVPLVAKFVFQKEDGIHYLVVCNTNNGKTEFINDAIIRIGLADPKPEDSNHTPEYE